MFCKKCGKQIEDDSVFCNFCGENTAFNGNSSESGGLTDTAAKAGISAGAKAIIAATACLVVVIAGGTGAYLISNNSVNADTSSIAAASQTANELTDSGAEMADSEISSEASTVTTVPTETQMQETAETAESESENSTDINAEMLLGLSKSAYFGLCDENYTGGLNSDGNNSSAPSCGQQGAVEGYTSELYPEYKVGYVNYPASGEGLADDSAAFDVINVSDGGFINDNIYVGMTYEEIMQYADCVSGLGATFGIPSLAVEAYIDGREWLIGFEISESQEEAFRNQSYATALNLYDICGSLEEFIPVDINGMNLKSNFAVNNDWNSSYRNSDTYATECRVKSSESPEMRTCPDENSPVICLLPANSVVKVHIKYEKVWSYVEYTDDDGVTRYGNVMSEYLDMW